MPATFLCVPLSDGGNRFRSSAPDPTSLWCPSCLSFHSPCWSLRLSTSSGLPPAAPPAPLPSSSSAGLLFSFSFNFFLLFFVFSPSTACSAVSAFILLHLPQPLPRSRSRVSCCFLLAVCFFGVGLLASLYAALLWWLDDRTERRHVSDAETPLEKKKKKTSRKQGRRNKSDENIELQSSTRSCLLFL